MKQAVNRFWDWLFHPSIRLYTNKNFKASTYRYPSPGNYPGAYQQPQNYDYKTPYQHTPLNVRYLQPTSAQKHQQISVVKVLGYNPILILKKVGLLKKGEQNNVDAVNAAKKLFQQKYKFSVDSKIVKNDDNQMINISNNREQISAFIGSFYQNVLEVKKDGYDYAVDRKTIDDPQMVPLQSVDMFVLPHTQQQRIINQYTLDKIYNEAARNKNIQSHIGDAKFWKAIDSSFDNSQIEKVQKQIRDPTPTDFNFRKAKIQLQHDENGTVVDVHPKQ